MTVRVSGLFDTTDAAEGAVRGLEDIPVYTRRISHVTGRSLGTDLSALTGIAPETTSTATAFAVSNVGQGFGQGVFIPSSMLIEKQTECTNNEEVQLEVWVAPLDAPETAERFVNAHGRQVRLY